MGMLWDLLQKHIDNAPYPPSERQVARRLGVSPNTLAHWRDLKRLPSRENLQAIADLAGVRYSVVLDAALRDTGYHESATVTPLRRRPVTTIEAELEAARETLADWESLDLSGPEADSKRRDLSSKVDALEAELVASRRAIAGADSVAEL
jgi:transcriptional regulator with XRE-family HTH domain